jgi:hypothetical protein
MYVAGGSAPAAPATDRFPLPLAGIVSRAFPGERPYDAYMLGLLEDLAGLYGVPYDRAACAGRRRATFTTMVAGLLDELIGDGEPVGLVVLAHGTPDGEPNWPACFLTSKLPGEPFAFAVADQGPVAPFTALRIAASYVRAGDLRRAILIILDQDTVLCDPAMADRSPLPVENRAVALVFDERGRLGELSAEVSAEVSTADRLVGPSSSPGTGEWATLADRLEWWRSCGAERIMLAGRDPVSGAEGRCVLFLRGAGDGRG